MSLGLVLQHLVNAAQVSAVYALLAASYVLIHGLTGRVNLAFGALSIWAGYVFINTGLAAMLEMPGAVVPALVGAAAVAMGHTVLAGRVTERLAIRPVQRESSLAMLVTTLGLAIVLEEVMRLTNDSRDRWLPPVLAEPVALTAPGAGGFAVHIGQAQLVVVAVAAALCAALIAFIARHPFGRAWRACAQDLRMAELCGIDVGRTLGLTFVLASACAASAGILISLLYGVASYSGGLVIGLKTLFIAVVGGLSSIPGAIAGAVILGLFETFWSAVMGPLYRDAAAFLALTGLMILFPQGLLGGGRIKTV